MLRTKKITKKGAAGSLYVLSSLQRGKPNAYHAHKTQQNADGQNDTDGFFHSLSLALLSDPAKYLPLLDFITEIPVMQLKLLFSFRSGNLG